LRTSYDQDFDRGYLTASVIGPFKATFVGLRHPSLEKEVRWCGIVVGATTFRITALSVTTPSIIAEYCRAECYLC
jgi:hypothetical protein